MLSLVLAFLSSTDVLTTSESGGGKSKEKRSRIFNDSLGVSWWAVEAASQRTNNRNTFSMEDGGLWSIELH
jgi:hypothetical protein